MTKEKVQKIVDANPFAHDIGMEVVELKKGYALGKVIFADRHRNFYGGMHGGCAYALADTMAGIAALTYGRYVTTVSSSINYLKAIGEDVYCEAKVVKNGKTLTVCSVAIMNEEKELLVDGSFTYFVLDEIKE